MLKNQRELVYGQTLKVTMENVAEKEEVKEQQQQGDDERYDTVPNLKLVYKGMCVKEFRVTINLNCANTRMIMANITPHIKMKTKVIYSLKSEHRSIEMLVKL